MVTRAGNALLAALLPFAVHSFRGRFDVATAASVREPTNQDRMECLRQDNLDLAGTRDSAERFILRMVVGVNAEDTERDIYLFAEKLHISRLQAELRLTRSGPDAVEFELLGSDSVEGHTGVGRADLWIAGFEVHTNDDLMNWASSLAANREVLSKGQNGTVYFALGGKVRAKKEKGSWVAELISTEVRFFRFNFQNQRILDFALNRYGGMDQLVLDNLFKLVEAAMPINLLASLQFLPQSDNRIPEREDLWLNARMALSGHMAEVNGPLMLESSLEVTAHLVPAKLLDVLLNNFNVEHLAEELVRAFLDDPTVAQALQTGRRSLIDNLHEYRFVIGDNIKSLMAAQDLQSLRPVLMEEARKITSDLLVRSLQPFLKAHAEGKADYFNGFKVQLGGGAGWDGLARAQLHPGMEMREEAGDDSQMYSFAEASDGLLDALGLADLLPKLPSNGTLVEAEFQGFRFDSHRMLLALASVSNWVQKAGASDNATAKREIVAAEVKDIALGLPEAWAQPFGLACSGGKITLDPVGKIKLWGGAGGAEVRQTKHMTRSPRGGRQRVFKAADTMDARVPPEFQRPTAKEPDMTLIDRILIAYGNVSLDVVGNEQGGLHLKIQSMLQMTLDVKAIMVSALAAPPTQDFGYVFFADEFIWKDNDGKNARTVMAVLNCGFLRLLEWPLRDRLSRLEMTHGQLQVNLVGMKKPSFDIYEEPCVLIKRMKPGFLYGQSEVTERLCATRDKAHALYNALQLQLRRLDDINAAQWGYGTHDAEKPQYVLPPDTVQANLLSVVDEFTWGKLPAGGQLKSHPVLLQTATDSEASSSQANSKSSSTRASLAKPHRIRAPVKVPTRKGSFESKACRAQEELDTIRYPPEDHGNASIRMVVPATPIGDVHFLIEQIQVVSFDVVGKLVRNSDTTFLFEIEGRDGPGIVHAYVQGIDFKAPDSAVEGITKAASSLDSFFRPVFTFGYKKADSLKEGPLKATFNMKGEFKLSEGGHWEVLPKAVSDVKFEFGRGGLVQGLINYLVAAYGNMDEIFLTSFWPVLASIIPESLGQAFVQIPMRVGELAHHFSIQGHCLVPEESNERCVTDQVHITVKDVTTTALLPGPVTEKFLASQGCTPDRCEAKEESLPMMLLHSYLHTYSQASQAASSVFAGTSVKAAVGVDVPSMRQFPKIRLTSSAAAPMKLLETAIGNGTNLNNLLPATPGKLTAVGSVSIIEGNKAVIPEVRLERLRLPLLLHGEKEALELNLTLSKATLIMESPASSMMDVLVGHFEMTLDRIRGLAFAKGDNPLLDVTVNREYLREVFSAIEHGWPEPLNVRTAHANRSDGLVPEDFRQKQALAPGELDIERTLSEAYARASISLEGDHDPDSGEDLLNFSAGISLTTTLDLGSAFWRALVTRRQKDFGFVHLSRLGKFGMLEYGRLPERAVLLDIGCGQLRIFDHGEDAKPYKKLLHSADLIDVWSDKDFVEEFSSAGPCMFVTWHFETLFWQKYYFCAEAKSMRLVREALELQRARFNSVESAIHDAQAQDAESFEATRAAGYPALEPSEPAQFFVDSTWFRQLNPFDVKSWTPDLPPARGGDVETPLQRWANAQK